MVRIPTKVPGMVRQGGAAGCFGFGASGSLRTFLGMDFGHFLVNHREEKIEVGSVPSGPNVGVEGFWERGGCLKLGRLFQRRGPYPIFSGRVLHAIETASVEQSILFLKPQPPVDSKAIYLSQFLKTN